MTEEQKKQLRNHLPQLKRYIEVFLHCLDIEAGTAEEKAYLLSLIDKMENLLDEAKDIVEE